MMKIVSWHCHIKWLSYVCSVIVTLYLRHILHCCSQVALLWVVSEGRRKRSLGYLSWRNEISVSENGMVEYYTEDRCHFLICRTLHLCSAQSYLTRQCCNIPRCRRAGRAVNPWFYSMQGGVLLGLRQSRAPLGSGHVCLQLFQSCCLISCGSLDCE